MPIIAKGGGGDFKLISAGMHPGRCVRIIDLGTQDNNFKGQVTKRHEIRIGFEIYDELITIDGKELPAMAWWSGGLSINEKSNLGKLLEGWRGKKFTDEERNGFDISKLLGQPCVVNIIHSDDGKYANIASVSIPMKGMTIPEAVAETYVYEIEMGRGGTWDKLSDKTKEKIEKSYEFVPEAKEEESIAPSQTQVQVDYSDIPDESLPF